MLKQIVIQDLQPGMVIMRVTEQNGPVKIKKSGLVTSREMVQGLIEMGIQQVEIDPDQTVEVATPSIKKSTAIKKSATLRMLESNKVLSSQNEDGLSEQYHRSLFLPSVQDIPSAWQFYTKRYLLAAFIAIGGLGLGWTLANYQEIITLLKPQVAKPIVSVPAPVTPLDNQTTEQVNIDIEPSTQADKPTDANLNLIANENVQPVALPDEVKQSPEPIAEEQTITPPSEPEPTAQISADVLARFRKAMNEVEKLPVTVTPPPVQRLTTSKDVPRVDQLPAWVMTRLPSMAFSAHMYASEESERWVIVNGTRMVEGDKIDGEIEIVRIEPQHVILNFSGQTFSMAALTDW